MAKKEKQAVVGEPKPRKPREPSPIVRVMVDAEVTLPGGMKTTAKVPAWQIGELIYPSREAAQMMVRENVARATQTARGELLVDKAYRDLYLADARLGGALERVSRAVECGAVIAPTVRSSLTTIRNQIQAILKALVCGTKAAESLKCSDEKPVAKP